MKRRHCLKSTLFVLTLLPSLTFSASAQGRAYAKFGPRGETIGLFNLMRKTARCANWQVFTGTVTRVRSEKRNKRVDYQFSLNGAGKLRIFAFTLDVDEIPQIDIENLLTKKQGVRVRACESKRRWTVEEIVRTETTQSDEDAMRLDAVVVIDQPR